MRLNRGTISLLLVGIVIIGAVLVLNSIQVEAPGDDPTPTVEGYVGLLYPDISTDNLTQLEISQGSDEELGTPGGFIRLTRDLGDGETPNTQAPWLINAATNENPEFELDPIRTSTAIETFASLQSLDSFDVEDLEPFGLENPSAILTATNAEGSTFRLRVGDASPTAPRYYVAISDDDDTIYLVQRSTLDTLLRLVAMPPYVPTATPLATLTFTPNPFSEVDQTATAVIEQTSTAGANATATTIALTPTAEPTAEGSPEATNEEPSATVSQEPDDETPESTIAPSATPEPDDADPTETVAPSATPQPTDNDDE